VSRCTFEITGGPALSNVVVVGKSCGNLRILDNHIRASHVAAIFDTHADIQSQKHGDEGKIIVRGNTIETNGAVQIFSPPKSDRLAVEENSITSR
jgi:hypothetical protein